MSIPSVAATGRTTPIAAEPSAQPPSSAARQTVRKEGEAEGDQPKQPSAPLRFPWLSRLSQQLESATGQRPPFQPAPVLGDNVNRSA